MEKKSHKTSMSLKSNSAASATAGAIPAPATISPHHHNTTASGKYRTSTGSSHIGGHHHQRNQNLHSGNKQTNNNALSTIANVKTLTCTPKTTAGATNDMALDKLAVNPKTITVRNKNEEAITDLRARIPEIENIFDVHSRIGNGTFSTVLLGTLKKEREVPENMRRKFAIKHHIPTSHPDRIMKELQCMARIGGTDNVVGINCCIRYNESVAFIMPYMAHDRFHDFFNKMDLNEVQYYIKNLLIALRHVHKFNVIHRDVKPSNFLYNRRKRQFLLVDFGLAQQVPTPQMAGAIAYNNSGISNTVNFPLTTVPGLDGKRAREHDESTLSGKDASAIGVDVSGVVKRIRCTGPQGDQHMLPNNISANSRAGTNSTTVNTGSPFKMPLKQLNEITMSGKTTGTASTANGSNTHSGQYDVPPQRQPKSAVTGAAVPNRMQHKLQTVSGQSAGRSTGQGSNPIGTAFNATTPVPPTTVIATNPSSDHTLTAKYNTNRNLNSANGAKCYCYGNPQVCNICLIKKEIHASRAGTPGYRPPEVLLKYPDQTTAVDVWAVGVIFLSILSSVYPFFKAPNDYVALAEMVTIFGDKTIRKTAFTLDRLVTLSQKTKPLDLRKLCVRFRNRTKFSAPELLKKYQQTDGTCEVCKNCDQFFFNCLCTETNYNTEPLDADDSFPPSAYDLLYKLLEVNPHKRITAEEALKHPFFSESSNCFSSKGSD